jgi:hypothetical protein
MTTARETTAETGPIRRPPLIVIVDVLLPVVLVFWTIVDRSASAVWSWTQPGRSSDAELH